MFRLLPRFCIAFSFLYSSLTLACLEIPKTLSLSQTSYEKDVKIDFGLNCGVSMSLNDKTGMRSIDYQPQEDQSIQLCLVYTPKDKRTNELLRDRQKKYCGNELKSNRPDLKEALALTGNNGQTVGQISITPRSFEILSVKNGTTDTSLPYFSVNAPEADRWKISAWDNKSEQVGAFDAVSEECSRGLGLQAKGGSNLDIRGKQINVGQGGCQSSLVSKPYQKNSRPKAIFTVDGGAQ